MPCFVQEIAELDALLEELSPEVEVRGVLLFPLKSLANGAGEGFEEFERCFIHDALLFNAGPAGMLKSWGDSPGKVVRRASGEAKKRGCEHPGSIY